MEASNFNLARYFQRIGYTGAVHPDLPTLQGLMRQQLFNVPFENLDVQAGRVVSLVPEDIVDKLVERQRGGYCYEVNGLFAMALQAIGIPYHFVAARPMFYPVRRPRTHMAIVAHIDGQDWLCDLGFGSYGIRAPMPMHALGDTIQQDSDAFRLTLLNGSEYLLQAWVDGEWGNQYGFERHPQEWIDFMPANHLNSTHPDAIFVQKLLIVLHHPDGRDILLGDALKTVRHGQVTRQQINQADLPALLRDTFKLPPDAL